MATFEYDGKPITVAITSEIELGELAYVKEHFGVSGLVELEAGMAAMEPDAWRAVLITSIRRVNEDVSPVDPAIDDVAILPLVEALNRERAERLAAEEQKADRRGRARPTSRSRKPSPGPSGASSSA